METLALKLQLNGRFIFTGQRDNVDDILHDVDILVHPSLTEGLSNVVLEGMAALAFQSWRHASAGIPNWCRMAERDCLSRHKMTRPWRKRLLFCWIVRISPGSLGKAGVRGLPESSP